MKKFYISIFTAVLLFTTLLSQAQVYNSIDDGNPNGYTLDDPRFWVGGVPPPNGCSGCTIRISSPVTQVPCCGFTTSRATVLTTQTPTRGVFNDGPPGDGITVGMKFQASIASTVTGVKFYKLATMTGAHTGLLYDNSAPGTPLGTVAFTTESPSGWQSVNFATPISILANHTYTIAVFMGDGNYTSDLNFFTAPVTNSVLTAVADGGPDGNNGAFSIGTAPAFPLAGNVSSNYWVDVIFAVDGPFLNEVSVTNNTTINLYGSTTFTVNTYLRLFNSSLTIGNDPTSLETVKLNGQLELNGTSYVQLANSLTAIDANPTAVPVVGPYEELGNPGNFVPGIYSVTTNPGIAAGYTATLQTGGLGSEEAGYFPPPDNLSYYTMNCGTPTFTYDCTDGFVFGPAITQLATNPLSGIVFVGSTTLPVQLVKLLANNDGNGGVRVSWATSQEQNSAYFDVERSSDQTGWIKIGSVKAKGYSSTTSDYSFTDKIPLDGNGYYRLKMVDLDGKFKYSKAVSVDNGNDNQPLVIYSNPFNDQIRLKVNVSRAQNLTLSVSDMLGKTYITQSYNAQQGDNFINLRANAGGSGMYILRIHGDSYEQTVKLEKQ